MIRKPASNSPLRFVISGALATALIIGAAGTGQIALAGTGSNETASTGAPPSKSEPKLFKIEKQVFHNPGDVALRASLAQAYLDAGRFEAAVTTYNDVIALGGGDARVALRLALAYMGTGRHNEALSVLDQYRDGIPSSDLGLAAALAGQPGQGVAILEAALRGGESSVKLRQNLAYAYALDGRWAEARLMAAQDVPAGELDERMSAWAQQSRPDDTRKRIATLLGVPVRSDPGQPVLLALRSPAETGAPRMALGEDKTAPVSGELPSIDGARSAAALAQATAAPPVAAPAPERFEQAFAEAPAAATTAQAAFVSRPVIQPVSAPASKPQARKTVSAFLPSRAAKPAIAVADCTHMVQLGSYSSAEGAKRAWKVLSARYPELANREMTITPALVNGRKYWRVAAGSTSRNDAAGLCSSVKGRGGACIAHAADRPLPGALPARRSGVPTMARR